jgi:hypothetical protein
MNILRTNLSLKREQKRTSLETLEFKAKLCSLLENAPPIVSYRIKQDLAIQTDMPFYRDRPKKIKGKRISYRDYLKQILNFFILQSDDEFTFIVGLLRRLSVNQNQIIRKLAPRKSIIKKEIWEHAIPVKIIVDELIEMIRKKDISELDKLLDVYELAGQRSLTKEQDFKLKEFKTSMPKGWNWRAIDVNPLERHHIVGIYH